MRFPVIFCCTLFFLDRWVHGDHALGKQKRQAVTPQNPGVWQALDELRGSTAPTAADIQRIVAGAVPGQSYPTLAYIPQTTFTCSNVRQPGFYADPETRCQVFRRCEANGYMFSYICPNSTLYNQITLVCDYWYNVNCPNSQAFVDYSNPRIYVQNAQLLDDSNYGSQSSAGYSSAQGLSNAGYNVGNPQSPIVYAPAQSGPYSAGQSAYQTPVHNPIGSYTGPTQTLSYGAPLQQTTYPTAIRYSQYNAPALPAPVQYQAPSGYASNPYAPSSKPSYRSLSNRLLKLHADGSDRIQERISTQVSSPSTLVSSVATTTEQQTEQA